MKSKLVIGVQAAVFILQTAQLGNIPLQSETQTFNSLITPPLYQWRITSSKRVETLKLRSIQSERGMRTKVVKSSNNFTKAN